MVEKTKKEYNRAIRLGRKLYCNLSCATYGKPALVKNFGLHVREILGNIRKPDELSPFRYYLSKARSTERKLWYGETNLTLDYLRDLWTNQLGICPYTGHYMELPISTQTANRKPSPTRASLDRIDSSKGYVQGNVEFVCQAVNLAKQSFSREQMISFFKRIE